MRKSGIVLTLSTLAWLASCVVLAIVWIAITFDPMSSPTVAEVRAQGVWGMWLSGVAIAGAALLCLASAAMSRKNAAIAFGVISALLILPVCNLAFYSYKEMKYQPCPQGDTALWDCPTDLD